MILKARAKRETEIKLAKVIKELEAEKKKVANLEEKKKNIQARREKARTDMRNKMGSGQASIKDSQFHLGFITKLKEDEDVVEQEIKEQKEVVRQVEDKLKRARRDYRDAGRQAAAGPGAQRLARD